MKLLLKRERERERGLSSVLTCAILHLSRICWFADPPNHFCTSSSCSVELTESSEEHIMSSSHEVGSQRIPEIIDSIGCSERLSDKTSLCISASPRSRFFSAGPRFVFSGTVRSNQSWTTLRDIFQPLFLFYFLYADGCHQNIPHGHSSLVLLTFLCNAAHAGFCSQQYFALLHATTALRYHFVNVGFSCGNCTWRGTFATGQEPTTLQDFFSLGSWPSMRWRSEDNYKDSFSQFLLSSLEPQTRSHKVPIECLALSHTVLTTKWYTHDWKRFMTVVHLRQRQQRTELTKRWSPDTGRGRRAN